MNSISLYKLEHIIVATYIVLMSTQLIPLEGYVISPVKVIAMLFAPLILIILGYIKQISNALVYGSIYILIIISCTLLSSPAVAWNRIGYRAMYVMMFICVYSIIYKKHINLDFIRSILQTIIIAYGVIFIVQYSLYYLVGIRELSFLNFYGSVSMKGVFKPNGLAIEASHAARILTVLYWGFLKLTEIKRGTPIKFKETWKGDYILITSLFWFSMISMSSATAIIGILLVLSYFFSKNIVLIFIALIAFIVMMNVEIDNLTIKRIQVVFNSFFSNDVANSLKIGEGSGAVRILPIVNTITNLDLFSWSFWVGQGSVQSHNIDFVKQMFRENRYIGDITDYGLFSYLTSLLFVYKCCIRKFFSLESLMFLLLATFSVGSIYYTWFMLIVFFLIKYYSIEYEKRRMHC